MKTQTENQIDDQNGNKSKPLLAVVNSSETFEDYFKRQIEEGYILENGKPIKCECGCADFKQVDKYFGEGYIEEYALECTNEDCLKIVGRWSYGSWLV
jgi:hypothetical protein